MDGEDGPIRIGAMATMEAIASHEAIRRNFGILAQAAGKLGSPLIRSRATIGGNLVNARPAADTHGPLMCLGAKVTLESDSGSREIPVEDFLVGPGECLRRPNELLTRITIDRIEAPGTGVYLKYGIRKTLEIGLVNVAVHLGLAEGQTVKDARIALGAVAPKTIRSPDAEQCLIGHRPDEETIQRAAKAAAAQCQPISDIRGSAEYRRILVEVLTGRAIREAVNQTVSV